MDIDHELTRAGDRIYTRMSELGIPEEKADSVLEAVEEEMRQLAADAMEDMAQRMAEAAAERVRGMQGT